MHLPSQSESFLEGEGDAWFERNYFNDDQVDDFIKKDTILKAVSGLPLEKSETIKVLEIGCGQGLRLDYLKQYFKWDVWGIDPSSKAINCLLKKNLNGKVGTAEKLDFCNKYFDILIYGHCLCWVDRFDLFKVASEADRVLKSDAWIIVKDFWSPFYKKNKYTHKRGLETYKSSIHEMFTWHPAYVVTDHTLRSAGKKTYTDNMENWIATTIIRKSKSYI